MRARAADTLDPRQQTTAWQAASLLLGYPDEQLLTRLPLLRAATRELPPHVRDPLEACLDRLTGPGLTDLQADYVETFDTRRRHTLFLTYFVHGDTRKRGMALLRFKQAYLDSGFELTDSELPDHLCVVLEYAATIDQEHGRRLILDHRAGLEMLRIALTEAGSRWAGAIDGVCATLPPLRGEEWAAVHQLAAEGPPEEEVGMTPYATPGFDTGPAAPSGAVRLPMPAFPTSTTSGAR